MPSPRLRLGSLLAPVACALAASAVTFVACGEATDNGFKPSTDAAVEPDTNLVFEPDAGSVMPADAAPKTCATGKTGARRAPAYIQLVLDGSGSMSGKKWNAVQDAVELVVNQWEADNDATLGVGVSVFSDSDDPTRGSGPYPSVADVPIAKVDANQANSLRDRVLLASSCGGTPSYTALSGNFKYLDTVFRPDKATPPLPLGGTKILFFMSDGDPTDDCSGDGTPCYTLVSSYKRKGFITYSALFADSSTSQSLREFMATIAKTGGGAANANCVLTATPSTPTKLCHFEVDTTASQQTIAQKFYDAIEAARAKSIDPCKLAIEKQGTDSFDPKLVNVDIVDGKGVSTPVNKDPANGWSYDDETNPANVILTGTACDKVKADRKASVELTLGCPTEQGAGQ